MHIFPPATKQFAFNWSNQCDYMLTSENLRVIRITKTSGKLFVSWTRKLHSLLKVDNDLCFQYWQWFSYLRAKVTELPYTLNLMNCTICLLSLWQYDVISHFGDLIYIQRAFNGPYCGHLIIYKQYMNMELERSHTHNGL